jgi:polysaccharide export outer membrane protein
MKKGSVIIVAVVGLAGISSAEKQPKPPAATAKPPADPVAHAAGAPIDAKTYIIGAEDVLFLKVWNEGQLTGAVIVRPDGKISLPLVGEMQAAGTTPEKLASNISEGLTKFLTHPDVSVAVQQVNSKKYFIMGEVQKTGSFPLVVPTTVLEALVQAGGFRDFAKTGNIIILRRGERLKFNYKNVIKGKNTDQNIQLEAGDQIIVP